MRLAPLRKLMQSDYAAPIGEQWTTESQSCFDELRETLLSDPCIKRYDHTKLLVLCTDFSSFGFGYVATQPADDQVSFDAMKRRMDGGDFDFLKKDSKASLHPVAFGSRRTRGNETKLHSHLGEGFAGDWAINKCRHMCFGKNSHGSLTVMPFVSFCHMMERTLLSLDSK